MYAPGQLVRDLPESAGMAGPYVTVESIDLGLKLSFMQVTVVNFQNATCCNIQHHLMSWDMEFVHLL
jgi:hypothetical protein